MTLPTLDEIRFAKRPNKPSISPHHAANFTKHLAVVQLAVPLQKDPIRLIIPSAPCLLHISPVPIPKWSPALSTSSSLPNSAELGLRFEWAAELRRKMGEVEGHMPCWLAPILDELVALWKAVRKAGTDQSRFEELRHLLPLREGALHQLVVSIHGPEGLVNSLLRLQGTEEWAATMIQFGDYFGVDLQCLKEDRFRGCIWSARKWDWVEVNEKLEEEDRAEAE
ncbi:hypothetical protein BJ508DRAFT_310740 [Ascobolus immersus RN42]|uniref:Uncharacterized protein n=1 Tax=Ascobolus immersus RN42 TaxID=1160509 RepID=A0A3N4HU34_ASCIM|nr:hypothetical protein BJ508DRAFT_310740 [Ascobolus immersus RN42]